MIGTNEGYKSKEKNKIDEYAFGKKKCVKSLVMFTSVGSKLKFIENVNSIETRDTCRNYETNVGKSLID